MVKASKVLLKNPKILEWARLEVGLDITDVAKHMKKNRDIMEAWENGIESPTFNQLADLANYYKRPLAAFFLPTVPPKSSKPDDYRTLPNTTSGYFTKETLIAYREVRNMLVETQELLDELDLNITFSLPTWEMKENPEKKATELRNLLGISIEKQITDFSSYYVALDTWRSVLFDHGVITRICRMPITDARAFCLLVDNLAGIGISNEDREHGKIFSLFHEVCHLSLNRPGISGISSKNQSPNQDIEQYCDRFSASFLLPYSHPEVVKSIKQFGESATLETAQNIANKFKVSKYVVARRALDQKEITPSHYWRIIEDWKRLDILYINKTKQTTKGGGNYNSTQINYIGKRFTGLVMEALTREYLTSIEAQRMTGVDPVALELALT